MKPASTIALLGAILLLAAGLRFTALDFGEGKVNVRPDEDAIPLTFVGMETDVLMPPLVIYGGGFFYPLRAFTKAWEWFELPTLSGPDLRPGAERIHIARWWSAGLSLLTVLLTFLAAWRFVGAEAGLMASAIVATSTLAVREAHFGKADSATAFASMVFILLAMDSVIHRRPRALILGIALGYAVSNKASVGLLLPAAYIFLRNAEGGRWRIHWRPLLIGAIASAVTVAAFNPHWFTQTSDAIVIAEVAIGNVSDNSWLVGFSAIPPPLEYHAAISLRYGSGFVLTWLTVPVLLYGLYRGPLSRVLSLCVFGPLLVFGSSPMVIARFILPLIAPLALLTAIAATAVVSRARPRVRRTALTLCTLAMIAEPTARSFGLVELLGQRDTRLLAGEWIEKNIDRNEALVSWGTPPGVHADWGSAPVGKRVLHRNLDPSQWQTEGVRYVLWHSYPLAHSSVPPPEDLTDLIPMALFDPFDGPTDTPVLEPMDAFYLPLGRLQGIARPGPRIAIYDLQNNAP